MLNRHRVLVLNKTWNAIAIASIQRAMILLFSTYKNGEPKAKIIDSTVFSTYTWEDWSKLVPDENDLKIRSANQEFKLPEIILLSRYDKIPRQKVSFSRKSLYKRDNYTCQYCGDNYPEISMEDLTIDHIHPRSRGGISSWTNCVIACLKCNMKKGDRLLSEIHNMKLTSTPKKPTFSLFKGDNIHVPDSWKNFVSEAYWNVELQP